MIHFYINNKESRIGWNYVKPWLFTSRLNIKLTASHLFNIVHCARFSQNSIQSLQATQTNNLLLQISLDIFNFKTRTPWTSTRTTSTHHGWHQTGTGMLPHSLLCCIKILQQKLVYLQKRKNNYSMPNKNAAIKNL